jgi:membrane protein
MSTSSGHWRVRSPQRRRRLWSALLGGILLVVGFRRRPADPEPTDVPELAKGRPPGHAATKARRAWQEIARLLHSAIGEHRVVSIAAGVTFFVLLAIFPAIGALVSIYGIFADPATIQAQLNNLSSLVPGGAIEIIGDQLQRVTSGGTSTLGLAFLVSLAIALWSANAGMKALFDALNIVYDAKETRGLIKLNAVSLAFTAGALIVLLLAIGAVVVLPIALQYIGLGSFAEWIIKLARWPALYVFVVLALAVIYRFGPDREHAQWHWITWGSAIAALVWIVVSILFSWYAGNFGSYNKTYGSLGAVIGFMTWIWISSMVILGGAEIDAIMERFDRGSAK